MKFNHSKDLYWELEPKKDAIIRIAKFASELVKSASKRKDDCAKTTIKIRYEEQDMEFSGVTDAEENIPPIKIVESFIVSSVYNAFGVVERDGPEFHLYVEYKKRNNLIWISASSTSGVSAQDLLLKTESFLASERNDKPSKTHPTDRKGNSGNKFYKSPIFWATCASAIVAAILWAIDRFVLGT